MNARELERELRRDGRRYAEAIVPLDGCTIADLRQEYSSDQSDRDVLSDAIQASEINARCYAGSICETIHEIVSSLDDDERADWLEDALYDAWEKGVEIGAHKVARSMTTRTGALKGIYR